MRSRCRLYSVVWGLYWSGLTGCSQPTPPEPPTVPVTVARPLSRDVSRYVLLDGRSEESATFEARARVEGKLEPLAPAFDEGTLVTKGQLPPWAVILTVPFAILGGIALTAARAYDINVYTQIGIVLLIGLSTKTAILIVEFAKQLHEEGKPIREAAEIAARLRFRAILMTAFSFILGVIPLVIASGAGAGSRRALGTAVFGGMCAATAFGVFVIPAFYVVVQSLAEWRQSKPSDPHAGIDTEPEKNADPSSD